jgi:hypothetical protein
MKILNLKSKIDNSNLNNNYFLNNIYNIKANDTVTPPSNKEWSNIVYSYNNKNNMHYNIYDNILLKIINGYFNMYNKTLNDKIRLRYINKRKRRILGNKVWIGKTEIKHTNDLVTINIFVYNRKVNFLIKKLNSITNNYYINKFYKIKQIIDNNTINNSTFRNIVTVYSSNINKLLSSFNLEKSKFNINNKYYNYLFVNMYSKYIKNIFKKELRVLQYKQYVKLYTLKYKNTYIIPLKKLINKIYKKRIIFNIVSLKNYFLDSNILTQIIGIKAKKRNNRILKVLKYALKKVRTPVFSKNLISREKNILNIKNNLLLKNNKELININDNIDLSIKNTFTEYKKENLDQEIIKSTKNKLVTGIRLESSGRLTRRFTAQRSVSKLRYKGTIKNIDSAYKGLSSKLLRNSTGSNLQYTKLRSKNRIGAFGIKGWTSSI